MTSLSTYHSREEAISNQGYATTAASPFSLTVAEPSAQTLLDSTVSRLDTFAYAVSQPSSLPKSEWARKGFSYDRRSSSVRCVSCLVAVFDWCTLSSPDAVRQLHQPNCQFADSSLGDFELVDELIDGHSPSTDDVTTDQTTDAAAYDRVVDLGQQAPDQTETRPDDTSQIVALREENRRLKTQMACRRCMITPIETLFLPCRHCVSCENCAEQQEFCIVCNSKILGTVRVYFT